MSDFKLYLRDFTDLARDMGLAVARQLQGRKAALSIGVLVILIAYSAWVSWTPAVISVPQQRQAAIGVQTLDAAIGVASSLLDKHGGYISNDVTVPWLDNVKNWEFGVLKQVRDFSRVLRNEISRSQSQSAEDKGLAKAEPKFNIDNKKWLFPRAEHEYRDGIKLLQDYRSRLQSGQGAAYFHANAENLVDWLSVIEKRLGNLVQRLGMSVGKVTLDDSTLTRAAEQGATIRPEDLSESIEKTSWFEIDDVFFEARGTVWALQALLQAAEADFAEVLIDKQASMQYRQVLRELQSANKPLKTLAIMNGGGFSMWPNHSLEMASYLGSANAALADLMVLLKNG